MNEEMKIIVTDEGQAALDADGPNGGIVKVHGLDDTKRTSERARQLSEQTGHKIVEVEVTTGSYNGVIYVIDPE